MVDKGQVEYGDFFTAMFSVMFGAFGVGQVSAVNVEVEVGLFGGDVLLLNQYDIHARHCQDEITGGTSIVPQMF